MSRREITAAFPRLKRHHLALTSPPTKTYNCIAWAVGDSSRWWWPLGHFFYWPANVPRREDLEAFVAAFATAGYARCDSEEYELGFEKIAVYADTSGKVTHAARQLPNGFWTSKLGSLEDISHTLYGIEGAQYGSVVQILRRPATRRP